MILPADKGNATVVLDRPTYEEMVSIIRNSSIYCRLKRDHQQGWKEYQSTSGIFTNEVSSQLRCETNWCPATPTHHRCTECQKCLSLNHWVPNISLDHWNWLESWYLRPENQTALWKLCRLYQHHPGIGPWGSKSTGQFWYSQSIHPCIYQQSSCGHSLRGYRMICCLSGPPYHLKTSML